MTKGRLTLTSGRDKDGVPGNDRKRAYQELRLQLAGWILFIVCAFFFMAAGFRHHDVLTILGSAVFLFACFLFLIPLVRKMRSQAGGDS